MVGCIDGAKHIWPCHYYTAKTAERSREIDQGEFMSGFQILSEIVFVNKLLLRKVRFIHEVSGEFRALDQCIIDRDKGVTES